MLSKIERVMPSSSRLQQQQQQLLQAALQTALQRLQWC
jgi:hypothetical protein